MGLFSSPVSLLSYKFHLLHQLKWKSGHERFPPRMTVLLWTLIVGIHSYVFCYGKVFFVHDVFSYIYDEVQFLIFLFQNFNVTLFYITLTKFSVSLRPRRSCNFTETTFSNETLVGKTLEKPLYLFFIFFLITELLKTFFFLNDDKKNLHGLSKIAKIICT